MTFERITSVRNPLTQRLRSLKDKKGRDETGWLLVEGEKLIHEALALDLAPHCLLYEERPQAPDALLRAFSAAGVPAHPVTGNVMEAVCDTRSPQGCCAAFDQPAPLVGRPERLVALDGVQDPGNVGAIWRTADAAGFDGLLLGVGCADPFSPKVQRAAMGSGLRLPCRMEADLAGTLKALGALGYAVVVSDLNGAPFYERAPLPDRFALVIGSEARGVSEAVRDTAIIRLKLPMRGGAESLNAAVAAGIMMYELTRDLPG
ncbi:TrmH family RNA methyltransferase [Bacillota bacterium Meth-B3]